MPPETRSCRWPARFVYAAGVVIVGWSVLMKIVYLVMRWLFGLAVLVARDDRANDAELLVLRHERGAGRPALTAVSLPKPRTPPETSAHDCAPSERCGADRFPAALAAAPAGR